MILPFVRGKHHVIGCGNLMPMIPDVHVNLDRPTIQHIYQLFMPIVPGGTLVIGFVLVHPDYLARLAASGIGYYSRIAAMVFVAYAVGLLLYALSVHFAFIVNTCLAHVVGRSQKLRPLRNNASISQNHVWRTVANAFLGEQLAPVPPTLLGGSTSLFMNSTHCDQPIPPNVQQYDTDWNDWYNVLQDYVLRGAPILAPEIYFLFSIVQATGWAIVVVSGPSRIARHHPLGLVAVALLIVLTALVQFGATYVYLNYDRLSAMDFTARLLTEIRAREAANRFGSDAQPQPK
jgi:hypothetical protein